MDNVLSRRTPFLTGGGLIQATPHGARLILPSASSTQYSDAQLDDYAGLRRGRYPHRPLLRLSLRARFSHDLENNPGNAEGAERFYSARWSPRLRGSLLGTAGFGFWNNPLGAQSKVPALPRAIWFFYASPPSNMPLALDAPGWGWKAACIDAGRASGLAWAPIAPLVMLACRSARLYGAIWPRVQRALGISESPLAFREGAMTDWHAYELEWRHDGARWWVDGELALETDRSPRGPLGFVAWIDNQYAVVTPRGSFKFGLLDAPFEQWMEVSEINVTSDE
ncbi:MAG: hypothetical protein ACRDGG_10900 [Anaerolineae bacterium]